jgi:hypothetical protein
MRRFFLQFGPSDTPAAPWLLFRDLCGEDEEAVTGTDTAQAIALLDRLLVPAAGAALAPGEADGLTASDRDRMLAAIYCAEYGAPIDCILTCDDCGEPFDIAFRLPELMASLSIGPDEMPVPRPPEIVLDDGRRLRMPVGRDELAILGLPPEQAVATLLARCGVGDGADPEDIAVAEALEQAAPILDVDLDARCPECGTAIVAHFDLQHYLLTAILREGPSRIRECHLLASSYGWSLNEILQLRRKRRRAFVDAIERERSAYASVF